MKISVALLIMVEMVGLSLISSPSVAKKEIITRKTQTVDFDEATVDGEARRPDAAYLVQKRAVDFVPLYKVREKFDDNIKRSIEFLK